MPAKANPNWCRSPEDDLAFDMGVVRRFVARRDYLLPSAASRLEFAKAQLVQHERCVWADPVVSPSQRAKVTNREDWNLRRLAWVRYIAELERGM